MKVVLGLFSFGWIVNIAECLYLLQITNSEADKSSIYVSAIITLAGGLVTFFLIYKKSQEERNKQQQAFTEKIESLGEKHAASIKQVYDTVVKEVTQTVNNNNQIANENTRLTKENIEQTKSLTSAIDRLREKLKD